MDVHERWYYELYNNEHNDIRNTLMTLMSLDIDNFEDAIHELYYYCDITHRLVFVISMINAFCRFGVTDPSITKTIYMLLGIGVL